MTTSHKGNGHPRRLVIVSNRLPFSVSMREGALHFNESTGGVVTGLGSFLGSMSPPFTSYLWVGWPGGTIEDSSKGELTGQAREKYRSLPVYLSEAEMENFYHGFCNKTIWPLFHYFPEFTVYKEEYWTQYRQVNEMFCDALIKELHEGDVIWIHDYHLMLLPKLVKARAPTLPVGFFLHIPFPSFELYRLLPEEWRKEILDGMLGADLVGFHTHEYTQHFLQSVLRLLGHENHMGQISLPSRVVRAETFPMGIDFQKFSSASARPEVMAEQKVVLPSLQGLKIILSVDRQDYSKGILNRLQAFEVFLEQNPQFHGKVVLIAIVVPSRIMVEHYEQMKRQIEECVGKINGKFGTINWTPIIYQYKQLTFEALSAMYTLSDVALVTPLRDGMNLIAKEYIASKADMSGVLILSEMAGAAQELSESIIINPNDRRAIARAMTEALEMPQEEQRRRMEVMR